MTASTDTIASPVGLLRLVADRGGALTHRRFDDEARSAPCDPVPFPERA